MTATTYEAAGRLPKRRFTIGILLFFIVVINYLDRTNLSVARAEGVMSTDLAISNDQMGFIFGIWGLAYALCQIPGGIIADRFRPRVLYPTLIALWSLATIIQGMAGSAILLIICRILVAVFEAPSYPINNRIVTSWFPERERASAISFYTSGQFVGLGLLVPLLVWFQGEFGWRWLFYACGLVGILAAAIWHAAYRDPDLDPTVSDAERGALRHGGAVMGDGNAKGAAPRMPSLSEFLSVLKSRKLWGIYMGQFCIGTVSMFFLTWFPTYLTEARGIDFKDIGVMAALPFIAAMFGILFSGFISDWLTRKGVSAATARKGPILIGVLLSTSILGSLYVESNTAMTGLMMLAFFGNGMASITWVFVSLLAPEGRIGLVGGVFNLVGGLSGFVTPWVFGMLIDGTDFSAGLIYVTLVALGAIFAYTVLVGRVERIVIPASADR